MVRIIQIIAGIIILIIFLSKDSKNDKQFTTNNNNKKIIGYDTKTGNPIYEKTSKIVGYNTKTGEPIYDNSPKIIGYNTQNGRPIYENQNNSTELFQARIPKQPLTEEEKTKISNSILMIAGSVLIVLASLVFLISSWDTIPNLLKTIVLIAVQFIFYLFSRICDKKLSIPKISKLFNYLTYAFLPIVLLSLSFFNLIGSFFSINEEGMYIYFMLIFIISDIIYKTIAKLKNDIVLKRMSFVTEILSLLSISNHFNLSFSAFLLILSIYNAIINLILENKIISNESYETPHNILTYTLTVILAVNIVYGKDNINNIAMFITSLTFYFKYLNSKEENITKLNLVSFIATYLITFIFINTLKLTPYFIYMFSLIPLLFFANTLKNSKLKSISYDIIFIVSIFILIISAFTNDKTIFYLLTFVISFILYFIGYITNKKPEYKMLAYISFGLMFFAICRIIDLLEIARYIPLVIVIIIYFLELLVDNLKDHCSNILIILLLYLSSILLIGKYTVLLPLICLLLYIKIENKDERLLIIPMLSSVSLYFMETNQLTTILTYFLTAIYTFLSLLHRKFNVYTIISLISIFLTCYIFNFNQVILFGTFLIWSILHIVLNLDNKNRLFNLACIISILGLYTNSLNELRFNIFTSIYSFGYYIGLIALTKFVLDINKSDAHFFECLGIILISIISIFNLQNAYDGLILSAILLILTIISFIKKWPFYFYSTLILMIINIIYITSSFWALIPWYIYILLIGIALIIFAMFDERKKININNILNNDNDNTNLENELNFTKTENDTHNIEIIKEVIAIEQNKTKEKLSKKINSKNTIKTKKNDIEKK